MAVDPVNINRDEYNARVTGWGSMVGQKLRASIRTLTSKGKGDLLKSLRMKAAKWYGEVDKLAYHFERHGVFVHKGVGRGYKMEGGRVIRGNANGKILTSRSVSTSRKPAEWFNPVVNSSIEGLANMVAEMDAARVVNATKILIK